MNRLERIVKAVELLNNEDKHFDNFVEEFYKITHPAGAPTYQVPQWLPNRLGHGANRNLPAKDEAEQHLQKQLDKTPTGDKDLTDEQHEIGRRYLPVLNHKSFLRKLLTGSIGSAVAAALFYTVGWNLPDYKANNPAVRQEIREHQEMRRYGMPYESPAETFQNMQEGRRATRNTMYGFGSLFAVAGFLLGAGYALKRKK